MNGDLKNIRDGDENNDKREELWKIKAEILTKALHLIVDGENRIHASLVMVEINGEQKERVLFRFSSSRERRAYYTRTKLVFLLEAGASAQTLQDNIADRR